MLQYINQGEKMKKNQEVKAWGLFHVPTKTVLPFAFPTRDKLREAKKQIKSDGALREVSVSITEIF